MNKFFVFLCFLILFFLVSLMFGKDINRMLSDFFNNIGKYLEKEFEKRKEIAEKELEKIILKIKQGIIESVERGLSNILEKIKKSIKESIESINF